MNCLPNRFSFLEYGCVQSYEDIVASPAFLQDLKALNTAIVQALEAAGEDAVINGNVLYRNKLENFHEAEFSPEMEPKRRALVAVAQRSRSFVEVGVAGGHAVLLALHANPALKAVGIDMAERLKPFWPPVDVFVPAAAHWLETRFPDRFRMIRKEAVAGLQDVAQTCPFGPVDMVHLDGGKKGRIQELEAIWPALAGQGYLMQGDYPNGHVQGDTAMMIARGLARDVTDPDLLAVYSKLFRTLEIGEDVLADSVELEDLKGKRVLVCTAHQDDEVLFAGGLLEQSAQNSQVTVACFFRPAEGRKDTETRGNSMRQVCDWLGVAHFQYPFAVEAHHRPLRRFIALNNDHQDSAAQQLRPIHRHGLYPLLQGAAFAAIQQFKPDIVITHNQAGEYGHREHVLLSCAVQDAARAADVSQLLVFGNGLADKPALTVRYDMRRKKQAFKFYMPHWNGPKIYDFALDPETFMRKALFPVPG